MISYDYRIETDFLNMTKTASTTKTKKLNPTILRTFVHQKTPEKKVKREPTNWKILVIHVKD